jgi:hypothetical protein
MNTVHVDVFVVAFLPNGHVDVFVVAFLPNGHVDVFVMGMSQYWSVSLLYLARSYQVDDQCDEGPSHQPTCQQP